MPPKFCGETFAEETFATIYKTSKFEKVSSLESCLLKSGLLPTVRLLVIPEDVLMPETLH